MSSVFLFSCSLLPFFLNLNYSAQLDDFVNPVLCQQFPHTHCVSTFCENHCSGFTVASGQFIMCVCVSICAARWLKKKVIYYSKSQRAITLRVLWLKYEKIPVILSQMYHYLKAIWITSRILPPLDVTLLLSTLEAHKHIIGNKGLPVIQQHLFSCTCRALWQK